MYCVSFIKNVCHKWRLFCFVTRLLPSMTCPDKQNKTAFTHHVCLFIQTLLFFNFKTGLCTSRSMCYSLYVLGSFFYVLHKINSFHYFCGSHSFQFQNCEYMTASNFNCCNCASLVFICYENKGWKCNPHISSIQLL